MRIKFKSPDPRAGTIAQMDSSRGQYFIDTGAAVQVKDDDGGESAASVATSATVEAVPAATKKAASTASVTKAKK